jgi:hypothetical protein
MISSLSSPVAIFAVGQQPKSIIIVTSLTKPLLSNYLVPPRLSPTATASAPLPIPIPVPAPTSASLAPPLSIPIPITTPTTLSPRISLSSHIRTATSTPGLRPVPISSPTTTSRPTPTTRFFLIPSSSRVSVLVPISVTISAPTSVSLARWASHSCAFASAAPAPRSARYVPIDVNRTGRSLDATTASTCRGSRSASGPGSPFTIPVSITRSISFPS